MAVPAEKIAGVGAAGASSAPTTWYGAVSGNLIDTVGPFGLAWAEWFRVLAAIYVAALLVKMAVRGIRWLRDGLK